MLDPQTLQTHYQSFLQQPNRILLTGHSHQAWPDVVRHALQEVFDDAALHVDDKWSKVFAKAEHIRHVIAQRCDLVADHVALGQNTHELFTRFLSALPLHQKPKVVVTDGEFHSVDRQLRAVSQPPSSQLSASQSLAHAIPLSHTVEVEWVPAHPVETLTQRLAQAVDHRCAAVVCSTVLFQDASIVPHFEILAQRCEQTHTRLFLDAYHSFSVVPFSLKTLQQKAPNAMIYLSGGGYKYAQWGEGVCWLSVPKHDDILPRFTGWFSAFEFLHEARSAERAIRYGQRGAERFAGSTFDPTSLYRAVAVSDFFEQQGMTMEQLRTLSLAQTEYLIEALTPDFDLITPRSAHARGGFVALHVEQADHWVKALRTEHIFTDARGSSLRLGPAPYLSFENLDRAIQVMKSLKNKIST